MLLVWQLTMGYTYYPADILSSFPLFFTGEITTSNFQALDSIAIFAPTDSLYSSEVKQGRLMLWNPYNFLGHPLYASGTSTPFYPIRALLHALLPVHRAHDMFLWLHLTAIGWAGYYFLRTLKLSYRTCVIGGAVWMLSGYHVGFLLLEACLPFGIWTPLTLALFYRAFGEERRLEFAVLSSLLCGVAGISGGLNLWAIFMIINGVWCLCLLFKGADIKTWLVAGSAMLVASLCLSIAVLPILEMSALSQRPEMTIEFQKALYSQFLRWLPILMVVPEFLGNPAQGLHITHITVGGTWFFQETFGYVGILTLLTVPLAWKYREKFEVKFFTSVVVICILCMISPFFEITRIIPGFAQMSLTRILYFIDFGLVVLGAFGLEALFHSEKLMAKLKTVCFGLGILLLLSLSWYTHTQRANAPQAALQALSNHTMLVPMLERYPSAEHHLQAAITNYADFHSWSSLSFLWPVIILGSLGLLGSFWSRINPKNRFVLLLVIVCLDQLCYGWRLYKGAPTEQFFPPRPEISYLQSQQQQSGFFRISSPAIRPNTLLPYRIPQLEGYQSLFPMRTALFAEKLQQGSEWRGIQLFPLTESSSPLLDLVGVKYLVRYRGNPPEATRMKSVFAHNLEIFENPDSLPLSWLVPEAAIRTNAEEVSEELGSYDPRQLVLVENGPETSALGSSGEVQVLEWLPGQARLNVSSEKGGWLVYNEMPYPGWEAEVDGQPVEIFPANLVQMAIQVPAGTKLVRFRFRPQKLRQGLSLTLLGLFIAAMTWLGIRKSSSPPKER